jgi:hypothetical protein
MCVNVDFNINYICYEETMLCKSSNLFIIIKFYLTQLSYNLASRERSASVVWCSKAVLSHVALRHDSCTLVSYWFIFSSLI